MQIQPMQSTIHISFACVCVFACLSETSVSVYSFMLLYYKYIIFDLVVFVYRLAEIDLSAFIEDHICFLFNSMSIANNRKNNLPFRCQRLLSSTIVYIQNTDFPNWRCKNAKGIVNSTIYSHIEQLRSPTMLKIPISTNFSNLSIYSLQKWMDNKKVEHLVWTNSTCLQEKKYCLSSIYSCIHCTSPLNRFSQSIFEFLFILKTRNLFTKTTFDRSYCTP